MEAMIKGSSPWADGRGTAYDTPYHNLAAAIIMLAARDYINLTRKMWDKSVSAKAKRNLIQERMEIEDFFHSAWCEMLTELDTDKLLDGCKCRAKELAKEAIVRKNEKLIKKQLKVEAAAKVMSENKTENIEENKEEGENNV